MTSMNAYSRDLRLKTLAAIERGIPRKGGPRPLRGLPLYHRTLAQEETPHRGRPDDEDPRQTICEGRGLEGVAPETAEDKPPSYPQGALRGFFGRDGHGGL